MSTEDPKQDAGAPGEHEDEEDTEGHGKAWKTQDPDFGSKETSRFPDLKASGDDEDDTEGPQSRAALTS
jgi:hypothetical protein